MRVHLLWLTGGWEDSKLLCAYFSKVEAIEHKKRLDNMTTTFDECIYEIQTIEVE